jgi:hypothetical protein
MLPLARCSGQRNGESADPEQPPAYTYYYAWSDFDVLSPGSWLVFLIFAWPVALLLFELISRRPASFIWLRATQILLTVVSMYVLYLRTFLYELWYGGYIAYAAFSIYVLASLGELVLLVRMRFRNRLSPPDARHP